MGSVTEIHCMTCNEDMADETDWATECGRDDCPHFRYHPPPSEPRISGEVDILTRLENHGRHPPHKGPDAYDAAVRIRNLMAEIERLRPDKNGFIFQIQQAIDEEREACAVIAEGQVDFVWIADTIRARKDRGRQVVDSDRTDQ